MASHVHALVLRGCYAIQRRETWGGSARQKTHVHFSIFSPDAFEFVTWRAGLSPDSYEASDRVRNSSSSGFLTKMRLLDTQTQKLHLFAGSNEPSAKRPPYAILSHTWEDDEILFVDISTQNQNWRQKAAADKVVRSCQLARKQGYEFIWIDTCCIDKSSSAELSEGEFRSSCRA